MQVLFMNGPKSGLLAHMKVDGASECVPPLNYPAATTVSMTGPGELQAWGILTT